MNKKDQEWIEYCQKIRIEERNKVVDECIKVVKKRAYAMVFIKELEALKITTSNPEQYENTGKKNRNRINPS